MFENRLMPNVRAFGSVVVSTFDVESAIRRRAPQCDHGAVGQEDWPELSLAEIVENGIPSWPEGELPAFTEAAVACWKNGDYAAAMWLYWDPDDLPLPLTHEIEVAKWENGRWSALGERVMAPAPGPLAWRPAEPVEWTATTQTILTTSTLWVLGGVARDNQAVAEVLQGESRWTQLPDAQSDCFLIGVEVPPIASVVVDSMPTRTLGHWEGASG